MTTCGPSQSVLFPGCEPKPSEESTSSAEGFPVPTSVSLGKESGSKGRRAGFGASTPGLWQSLDPVGCSLRTSVLSELEALTGYALTWRAKDTPSGRFWWVLGRSEPRTDASESGSSRDGWPTPNVGEKDCSPEHWDRRQQEKAAAGINLQKSLLVEARRSWTTPTRDDAGGRSTRYRQGGTSLSAQSQRSARPTATAEDARASGAAGYSTESGRHPGTTLTDAANGLWASPQARDWKDSGPTQGNRKSPNLGTQAHFPTPKASDGRSKGTGGTPDHGLDAMARAGLLDPESSSTSGKSRDWPTPDVGAVTGGRSARGQSKPGRQSTLAATGQRGVLNSRWVAQLMGYPPDWCDLPDDVIEKL